MPLPVMDDYGFVGVLGAATGDGAAGCAGTSGGWPTFTFSLKVGTARSAVKALLCRDEKLSLCPTIHSPAAPKGSSAVYPELHSVPVTVPLAAREPAVSDGTARSLLSLAVYSRSPPAG